jgi:hypothetical protein
VEIAQKLSDQLGRAENRVQELGARIAELEAEVKFYCDKSDRAELWLGKISNKKSNSEFLRALIESRRAHMVLHTNTGRCPLFESHVFASKTLKFSFHLFV